MDSKKILLVNLSKGRLGDINANLIGLLIVGKIQMAALSRVDMYGKKMEDFYLYIDEFQNVTTDSIESILSEARKYRLSLTVAHQYIAQLEENIKDAVFGNVGSMAVFRVGADDAQFLESKFKPVFTAADIMKIENYNAYLSMLINGQPTKPFNIKTYSPAQGIMEIVDKIKELSYLKYGRDRAEIEEEIMEKYRQ
jgi:DNA helicase HerA-like ATPase